VVDPALHERHAARDRRARCACARGVGGRHAGHPPHAARCVAICAAAFALSRSRRHPLHAPGWGRLWVVLGYFVVYWWLPDGDGAVRFARHLALAATVAAIYGIVSTTRGSTGIVVFSTRRIVRPRIEGARLRERRVLQAVPHGAHVLLLPLGFALAAAPAAGSAGWRCR
jgi:hypothetical protein